MSRLAISATAVTRTFGRGALAYQALRGVDFQATQGEMVFLAGPSGSGKTTLLSILGCVLTATSGQVQLFDQVISGRPERQLPQLRLQYIGFIFQGHNLIQALTARENVMMMLELRGWARGEASREATALLERVGLGERVNRLPSELSGGQRQRVAIARAVAGAPPIILADEPTASLDADSGRIVTELLRDMAKERGHTVVIVTHDNRIFHLADRIVHIEDGHIVEAHP